MSIEGRGDSEGAEYLDVLLLCAAPLNVRPALNLAVEVANFEAEVRRSPVPIRLRRVFPPTFDQLRRELAPTTLRGREPRVFHFLGHGEEDYLWFEDEEGGGDKVTAARLRRVFEGTPIRLALLNACWSATPRVRNLCTHLVEDAGLAAAIGHGKPVADASAIVFARRFYAEIARGQPVRPAYFAARNALAEQGLPGAAEIDLTGDGDFRLDAGLSPGERTGRVEDGMPTRGYLPGADFFCGREEEFRAVARALADPATRGYGLWGMGGIGKTALAKEAARRNAWRFRDGGVVFVDAREIAPPTTPDLLRRALARVDPAARGDDPVFELVARLTTAPCLIVLDNLETLPETELDALARFVAQVPANGSHVLMTARAPIRPIEDLPGVPTRLLTSGLNDYDGALYTHRLAVTKDVALLRDDPPRLEASEVRGLCARLARRVSGHPRMIEVAVGIARRGQAELDKALDQLTGDLESKLTEMLATGLALVGDEGRRLLAFLPLFPAGNFMPEAMQAACAAAERATIAVPPTPHPRPTLLARLASVLGRLFRKPRPPESDDDHGEDEDEAGSEEAPSARVVEGIRQLERGGFLDRDQEADLFTFHETLRDYSGRAAPLPPEQHAAALSGLLNYFAGYLRAYSGNDQAIDRCLDNALTVMETTGTARSEPGPLDAVLAGMVDALDYLFDLRGLWQLGDRWNERATSLRRSSRFAQDESALAHELNRRVILLVNSGKYEEAVTLTLESFQQYENACHLQGQATSLHQLAVIEHDRGNLAEARRLLERSLHIKEQLGDLEGLAASLHQLAAVESIQGNPAEARRLLQRSLGIFERLGDLGGQAPSLSMLAEIERSQGNPAEARRLLQRSLSIAERLGDPGSQASLLHDLAVIERDQGNPAEARRLLQRSLSIKERLGDLEGQGKSLQLIAVIARDQGNTAEARRLLERSLGIWDRLGVLRGQSGSLYELAMIEYDQGNLTEARGLLQRSLGIDERLGDLGGQANLLNLLAEIERAQGDPAEARRLWVRSIALFDRIGNVEGRASSLFMCAQMEMMEGNRETALSMARESVRLLEGLGSANVTTARTMLAFIESSDAGGSPAAPPFLAELGELLERAKDTGPEGGMAAIDAALEEARREAVPSREIVALLARGAACWNAGDVASSDESLRQAEETLRRVGEAESSALAELVEMCKVQRAKAMAASPKESGRLFAEAMLKAQAGDMAGAIGLYEASLTASRQEGDARGLAVHLLMIGQALLVLGRVEDARERLREGLAAAHVVGDEELLKAMQEVATVAAAMAERAEAEGAARRYDDVSER